ncbi:outer membrane beta-barrel protein [Campylobacter volucris]|uniref:outer membrane beta-barrel protein n=1 Tax=Campylobacter volucris TaxID=1031542 RepID=UPI00189F9E1C|nr:outer membrane beta-barrel protein [Campylobacter volucris]MBF7043345.1 outer membrane beta-barrel protein [Campylobacter volucris]MBF7045912.1 outer membrane beta-barrel protein [Campylobacter volucris]
MKLKSLSIIASIALLSNVAMADENSGLLLGVDAGWFHTQIDSSIKHRNNGQKANFNGDLEGNIPVFGLKIGYRINENHRVYSAYNYSSEMSDVITIPRFTIDGEFDTHKILFGYDFTPKVFDNTRAVLGLYGGYARTDLTLKTGRLSLSENFDGFTYGAKIGALYELNPSNEIEFGFKVEKTTYTSENFYQNNIGSNFYNPEQTNYGLYLGYTYKF